VWADNTDSIGDLPCLLTYLENHASNRHKSDATQSPTTGRCFRRAYNGAAAPSSRLPPLPHPPLLPRDASAATPAPTAGLFAGIHFRPGDRVTLSTASQGQVLLHSLAPCSLRSVLLRSATFA
jgi:hypothetical protein